MRAARPPRDEKTMIRVGGSGVVRVGGGCAPPPPVVARKLALLSAATPRPVRRRAHRGRTLSRSPLAWWGGASCLGYRTKALTTIGCRPAAAARAAQRIFISLNIAKE